MVLRHHHFICSNNVNTNTLETGDSTMVQSVSKTYQAHTSTNGSLIITSNKLR